MRSSFAFIVGIEKYDQPGWNITGPCANAVAVAKSCLSAGMKPESVFVFLESIEVNDAGIAALKDEGVALVASASSHTIDTFFRTSLAKNRPPNSRLLVFWSGHGFVENDGTRIFICRDYTATQLVNRVFNASGFLRYLRSEEFGCFSEQIFVADVCGVYPNSLRFSPDRSVPPKLAKTVKQTAYFATPEGKYALGGAGRGVFTDITVRVMGQFRDWPEQVAFLRLIDAEFQGVGETPFRVSVFGDLVERESCLVGTIATADKTPHFRSLISLLSSIELSDWIFRQHYLRTVSDLGEPKLAEAQGLSGMVAELLSLRDRVLPDNLPYGIIQFLLRLCQEDGLAQVIEPWLDDHAADQKNAKANVIQKLQAESAEKLLLIEVLNDENGRINAFQPFLRTHILRPVPDVSFAHQQVRNWEEFEWRLLEVIRGLRATPRIEAFQIHFLVDPPLFDRPFHAIPFVPGLALGEEFVVIVRHRERVRSKAAHVRAAWQAYAEALHRTSPCQVKFIRIPAPGSAIVALTDQKGLCYADFLLQSAAGSDTGNSHKKQLLLRLMRMGVPYLYWLHDLPPEGSLDQIEPTLAACLARFSTLDHFPVAFTQNRIGGNEYARRASLLWDDPRFNPFSVTE